MNRVRTAFRVGTVGALSVLGACHDESPPTGPSARPDVPQFSQNTQSEPPDPLLAHARTIPGFGGFFLDPSGQPTVYLKDAGQRGKAELALAGTLRGLGKTSAELRVVKGEYDYLQLHGWFTRAAPQALAVPGAVFADLDEGSNRLRLGVETAAAENGVRGALARLGIPGKAVLVERTEPIHLAATLRNAVAPRRGGLQIAFTKGFCTLGFNTFFQSGFIIVRSLITNSHCTNIRGGVDGTSFYQPVSPNLIATEVSDPAFFTGFPCPVNRKCRHSDAARARYASGVSSDLGGIARTTARAIADGPLTINSANPFFNITAELISVQGATVNKVGRTTGWTYGKIASTCAGTNVANTNITLLCQSRTAAGIIPGNSRPGDSGSPVFYWGGGNNVTLTGLLWGGNSSQTNFVFSPIANIELELGALKTF